MRELYGVGRIVGLDVGERRIGIAISDATGTLARPVTAVRVAGLQGAAVSAVVDAIASLEAGDDPVVAIVVGLPRRLDGTPNALTPQVESFASAIHARTQHPVHLQDERLTSREAESRLAVREKDWRARKARLDAAAAAIILQDYLDAHSPAGGLCVDAFPDPDS
jgi:putative Holliday junction resolvase